MLENLKKGYYKLILFTPVTACYSPPVNNLSTHYTEKSPQSQEMFCLVVCSAMSQTYILMKQKGEASLFLQF